MSTKNANNPTFSNNATLAIQGFDYQKLFALECCLKGKRGDIIYIECLGDVAVKSKTPAHNVSYETKLHHDIYNMTDQSPDFWKTLKNYVKEYSKITQFSKLILYTTASVGEKSIFDNWNSKSPEQKMQLIQPFQNNPNKTIQEFTKIIFGYNDIYKRENLVNILKKLEIHTDQVPIKEKCDEIKQMQIFITIDDKRQDAFLEKLYGYISLKAIDNQNLWIISYDDFVKDIQQHIRSFQQTEIPFPELPPGVEYTGYEVYRFIDELRAIDLEEEIESSVIDYLRSEKNSLKLIEMGGLFVKESIDNFEMELEDKMKAQKKVDSFEYSKIKSKMLSKRLFYKCKLFDKLKIRGVQPIELYYQRGKMHKIVEEHDFHWKFEQADLP